MNNSSFIRVGGLAAIGVGLCSLLYGILYVGLVVLGPRMDPIPSLTSFGIQVTNLLLAISGLLSLVATVAIFERVRRTGEAWARMALWFGMFSALLAGLHGWSDFVRNPALVDVSTQSDAARAAVLVVANLPSPLDPRGIGTFGLLGLFMLLLARLLYRTDGIPSRLADLATLSAVLLGLIFLGTVLYASGTGIGAARYLFLVAGPFQSVIVGPVFYVWLGTILRRTVLEAVARE